ncbi:hypothetical protein MAC_07755 [Metarhizium acridum CQMa 102]|uniref:Uncharacterized protein n=1 Tax=Metarhizium acridum (strain CQMa 102) TaxID=655827 RepID=E9ED07_METAQ|nr:uncharacterized protein MAC_07755 [Metarhizium acridum CQMa 102]EFY86232.1 hypothetical protein MAC_07755 [Metarhizium acridum CQMa 102]
MATTRLLSSRQSQDNGAIPDVCYDSCTASTGKSPKLCEPNSAFRIAYDNCSSCIKENTNRAGGKGIPGLERFLAFCNIESSATILTITPTARSTLTIVSTVPTGSTTSHTATSSFTPSPTPSSGPVETAVGASSGNKAWIAGAVIGSIVALALIIGTIIFLRRRSADRTAKSQDQTYEKAQLHADSLPGPGRKAADPDSGIVHEMPGTPSRAAEKPANEPAAHELAS